jgi:WD repeat-containing protein 61
MQAERIAHFTGHQGSVYAVCKLNEEEFLSGSGDHHLVQWHIKKEKEGNVLATFPSGIYSLLALQNGKILAGTGNGEIHLVDLLVQQQQKVVKPHSLSVFNMLYVESKGIIISVSGDGTMAISDAETLQLIKLFTIGNFKIRSILLSDDDACCFVGCGDGQVAIIDLNTLNVTHRFAAHTDGFSVNALAFSPGNQFLYTASRDARLNVFDIKNNFLPITSIAAHHYAIYGIQYAPSKKIMATISRDKSVKLWNPNPIEFLLKLDKENYMGHTHSVNTLQWLSSNILLTAGDDRSIMAWQINP